MTTFDWTDTIVAPATAPGIGSRGILRLAGPRAHQIIHELLVKQEQRSLCTGRSVIETEIVFDQSSIKLAVTILNWPAGQSSTGQEMAELHLPLAGPILEMLEADIWTRGARRARPGEFTLRAFLAGRMNLIEAEGVLGLVHAEDADLLREAIDQRAGGLSRPVLSVRSELLDLLADIEAGLDFVDEDISFVSDEDAQRRLTQVESLLQGLCDRWNSRASQRTLPRVVLVGPVNAGKSSLFNAMVGSDRALVSNKAGTTRDWIAAEIAHGESRFELIDTAGIDTDTDRWSQFLDRSRSAALRHADLVLYCSPADLPMRAHTVPTETPHLFVITKSDLASNLPSDHAHIAVSIHDRDALRSLVSRIVNEVSSREAARPGARVGENLRQALEAVRDARAYLQESMGHECVAASIRVSIDHLGEIVGAVYTNDLLDRIFSRFCIGK